MSCKISHYFKLRFHQMRKMNKSIFSRRELFQSPLKTAGNCCSLAFWLHQYSCSCHVQLSRWLCHPFSYTWAIKKLFFPFLTCLCGFWVNWLCFCLRKICVPLLSDNKNHQTWPLLISEDILRHVEIMCSQTSVVQGRVMGKTVLPIPIAADWMEKSHGIFEK